MQWHYRYTVLALCGLAFFVTYFARLAISPVVPFITADLGVSNARIGFALTGLWLAYGLTQFPSGLLADRFGEKPVIMLAVGGTTVMSLLLAFAPAFPVFVLCCIGLGGAAGLHYAVATTLLSRTFDEIGTAIGIHSFGGPLAGLIAPIVATGIGVRYGWRPAIASVLVVGVPIFFAFRSRIRATDPRRPNSVIRDRIDLRSLSALLTGSAIGLPLFVAMVGTYVTQGVLSFLPVFLADYRSFSPTNAGLAFSAFFVVRAIGQVVLGRASDRYGRVRSIMGAMALGSAGLVVLLAGSGPLAIGLGIVCTGVGVSFFSAIDPLFMERLPTADRGAGFGLVRTVYTVIGATGSAGVGVTADVFGWPVAFGTLAVLLAIAFSSLLAERTLRPAV